MVFQIATACICDFIKMVVDKNEKKNIGIV